MRKTTPIIAGTLVGILCGLMGLGLAGAGHGWTSAWPFGLLSVILSPLALYNLWNYDNSSREGSVAMLVIAVALDLFLFALTWREGFGYFRAVAPAAWLWIGLWLIWQFAVVATARRAPTLKEISSRRKKQA